jgi:hypothetical protein
MPKKHPPEWGWKAVKYRYIEKLESPSDIVARFKEKHRDVGKSWVKQRIANYEQTGHPNPPPERNASRKRATPRERKWLKKQLCLNPVQFFDHAAGWDMLAPSSSSPCVSSSLSESLARTSCCAWRWCREATTET